MDPCWQYQGSSRNTLSSLVMTEVLATSVPIAFLVVPHARSGPDIAKRWPGKIAEASSPCCHNAGQLVFG
eukprot:24961-Rhodomonas_salina.1